MEFGESDPSTYTRSRQQNPVVGDFHKIIDYLLKHSHQAPFSITGIIANTEVCETDVMDFLEILDKCFSLKTALEDKKSLRFEEDVIKNEPVHEENASCDDFMLISADQLPDNDLTSDETIQDKFIVKPQKAPRMAKNAKIKRNLPSHISLSLDEIKNINDFDLICSIAKSVEHSKLHSKTHFLDLVNAHPEFFTEVGDKFQISALGKGIATQYREFQRINSPLPDNIMIHETKIIIKRSA